MTYIGITVTLDLVHLVCVLISLQWINIHNYFVVPIKCIITVIR